MTETPNFGLPYIAAAQAQKHVTHNEALRLLDALVQLTVESATVTAPPVNPAPGSRWIVPAGATGAWAGWDFNVAAWIDGAWMRLVPRPGWQAWVLDAGHPAVFTPDGWETGAMAVAPHGALTRALLIEALVPTASGTAVTTPVVIPDRAIVLGVSSRTVTAVTGAASYDCGIAGEPGKFGGSLGVAPGSTNVGVIGPQAFYADTPVVLTANGGAFTGGAVRVALHALHPRAPLT
jgi:hypothetical protein